MTGLIHNERGLLTSERQVIERKLTHLANRIETAVERLVERMAPGVLTRPIPCCWTNEESFQESQGIPANTP